MINTKIEDGIIIATIDNPPTNSIDINNLLELKSIVDTVTFDETIKGLILTGEGNKFFCSGYDLPMFINFTTPEDVMNFFEHEESFLRRLFQCHKPVMSVINGHCTAGGFIIAMACDERYIVNNDKIRFGMPEITLGIGVTQGIMEILRYSIPNIKSLQDILFKGELMNFQSMWNYELTDNIKDFDTLMSMAKQKILKFDENKVVFADYKTNMRRPTIERLNNILSKNDWKQIVIEYILNEKAKEKFRNVVKLYTK